MATALLEVEDLRVHFAIAQGGLLRRRHVPLKAVDGVSFVLAAGETLGVVGESGCGKSTLGRAILRLIEPTAGRVVWLGDDLARLGGERTDLPAVMGEVLKAAMLRPADVLRYA